jgi:3-oxoacyl-[acyl-carrier-protein] synthase II
MENRVVVTGMGVVSPVGNTVDSFWTALAAGKCGIAPISYFDTTGTKFSLAADLKDFDPLTFLDKAAANRMDPFVQYAVCAAQQAMDDSGLAGNVYPVRLGICFGSGIGGFRTLGEEYRALLERGPRRVSPLFIPKIIDNIAAGSLAIRFGAKGPCWAVSTACATGTTAIGEAYRAIRHGYADAILCGGSEAAITPMGIAGFGSCMAISPSEDPSAASLPFDKRRAGFIMGEGAGALVLEEYEHALRRGAPIYAEVCGYGSTCDAYHVTAPDPAAETPARAIADAAAELGELPPSQIYFNAHGTGTPLNDVVETKAIRLAFGAGAEALHISSTKSMTGHMLGAAGAAEAIAAILAMNAGLVPPTIHLEEQDPECDLHYTPNKAVRAPLQAVMSVSLGFGGHNACVAFRKMGG